MHPIECAHSAAIGMRATTSSANYRVHFMHSGWRQRLPEF
jgi:hypothetical protein